MHPKGAVLKKEVRLAQGKPRASTLLWSPPRVGLGRLQFHQYFTDGEPSMLTYGPALAGSPPLPTGSEPESVKDGVIPTAGERRAVEGSRDKGMTVRMRCLILARFVRVIDVK